MAEYLVKLIDDKEMPEYTWYLKPPTEMSTVDEAEEIVDKHSFGAGGDKEMRRFAAAQVVRVEKKDESGDHKGEAVNDPRFRFTCRLIVVTLFLLPQSGWDVVSAGPGSAGT